MCGISGMIVPTPRGDLGLLVARMTQRLVHRGPDDGGVVAFDAAGTVQAHPLPAAGDPPEWPPWPALCALGVRRLAILDRSEAGRQPMASPDGAAWAAYNGEVYNHAALRDELAARGVAFRSTGDTEVVLAAWRCWGAACLERLDGMWALAVYEPAQRRLSLSRDPFGIKPLYAVPFAGGVAFASEIKALLELPGFERRVNTARLVDFLAEGWLDHTHETLYHGVHAVPGGCSLTIASEARHPALSRTLSRFWHPPVHVPRAAGERAGDRGATDTRARLDRLDEALIAHVRSDVPIGSCLSGGIDSSAVVASIHRLRQTQPERFAAWTQHTFTAILPGDPLDESAHAAAVVAACPGLLAHEVVPTPQGLLDDLDRLIWQQDEPFAGPSVYMQWEVMKSASAAGLTVVLDGQGGDELFCGYPGFVPPYLAARLMAGQLAVVREMASAEGVRAHFGRAALARQVAARLLPDATREALRRAAWRRRSVIHADLLGRYEPPPRHALDVQRRSLDAFDGFYLDVLLHRSLPALLHYEDRNAMAFSIEARVPLLARPVTDWALAAPADELMPAGVLKAPLRRALRGRVPDSVLDRRDKIGFAAPTTRWMQGPLRAWWSDLLASADCRQRGWLDGRSIARTVARLERGDLAAALAVWRAAIAEAWARRMLD